MCNRFVHFSQTIENHISMNGGTEILTNYSETGELNVSERRKMIKLIAEFMVERFGNKISIDDKISVAKATVDLFPVLRSKGKNIKPYVRCCCFFFNKN